MDRGRGVLSRGWPGARRCRNAGCVRTFQREWDLHERQQPRLRCEAKGARSSVPGFAMPKLSRASPRRQVCTPSTMSRCRRTAGALSGGGADAFGAQRCSTRRFNGFFAELAASVERLRSVYRLNPGQKAALGILQRADRVVSAGRRGLRLEREWESLMCQQGNRLA